MVKNKNKEVFRLEISNILPITFLYRSSNLNVQKNDQQRL